MSSRFSTSRVSRSSDSSAVARSSWRSVSSKTTFGVRSPWTAAFAEARGARRSWLTARRSAVRSLSASAIGTAAAACSASRCWRSASAAWVAKASTTRWSEASSVLPLSTRIRVSSTGTSVSPSLGVAQDGVPTLSATVHRRGSCRSVGVSGASGYALQESDRVEREGLLELLQEGRQGAGSAQDAAGDHGERVGLAAGAGGLLGAADREVDGDADGDGDQQEHDQREHVLDLGDGPGADRWREVVVQEQRADQGRGERRPQAARPARSRRRRPGRSGSGWTGTSSSRNGRQRHREHRHEDRRQREPEQQPGPRVASLLRTAQPRASRSPRG